MDITYHEAIKVVNAAITKAAELQIPISVAVVDVNEYLIAFARLDRGKDMINFAIKMAKTAMILGSEDDRLEIAVVYRGIHGHQMMDFKNELRNIAGTAMIKNAYGKIIGAVACSGGTPEQDSEIATIGASSLSQ